MNESLCTVSEQYILHDYVLWSEVFFNVALLYI